MNLTEYLIARKGQDAKGLRITGYTGKPGKIDEIKWMWSNILNDWEYDTSWVHILWNDGTRSDQTVDCLDAVTVDDKQ